jgi:hypothetical protein
MADAESPPTKVEPSRRVAPPASPIVDYGTAPLQLADKPDEGTLITEFIDEPVATSAETATFITDFIDDDGSAAPLSAAPWRARRSVRQMSGAVFAFSAWLIRSLFGIASLVLLLAVIAAIPIVNFLALGYLLEVEGRVARSGKLRDAFPLINLAPRLGSIVLGIWAWVFPLRLLSHAAADARLIDPGSSADIWLHLLVNVLAVLVTAHLCLALARGGSLWSFFRPVVVPLVVVTGALLALAFAKLAIIALAIMAVTGYVLLRRHTWPWFVSRVKEWFLLPFLPARGYFSDVGQLMTADYWARASAAVRDFIAGLRLKHHFLLGFKGYIGAMIWLVIPTALFAAASKTEGGPILVTLFGGVLLILVLSWVPFLQAHYAAENRFGAMFELRTVRRLYKNAPFSWTITMLITLTLALPMYLFKVALPPSDAMWMVTIVFIVSIYPVKVITGWAYHRALTREKRAFFGLRWFTRALLLPLLSLYVFLLFFTQFIGEHGKRVLFEHHAFLLPAPF